MSIRTIVYVDGFNLYYGCLRGTPYRRLNLGEFCRRVLRPCNTIVAINYYAARVTARDDANQPVRQNAYLRALSTRPEILIHFGQFLSHPVRLPLAHPQPGQPRTVKVIRVEEKGSDAKLATHLVSDAYRNAFDVAAVITNDSDLEEPIRLVSQELGKPVGLISPVLDPRRRPSVQLRKVATFIREVRRGTLAASQFPATLCDAKGIFHKPAIW